jgi:hypothetical protein
MIGVELSRAVVCGPMERADGSRVDDRTSTRLALAAECPPEGVGCRLVVLRRRVLVHAHRHRDVGVTETLRDDLHWHHRRPVSPQVWPGVTG